MPQSPHLTIRRAKAGEAKKISYLCHRCLSKTNSRDLSKKELQILLDHFRPANVKNLMQEQDIFIATLDDKTVGTAALDHSAIRSFFVNPHYYRQGIGKKIISHLESTAKKRGIKMLTVRSSQYAVGFYQAMGYKVKSSRKSEVGRITIMQKRLR